MLKTCTKCNKEKEQCDFYSYFYKARQKVIIKSICKECDNKRRKQHGINNKEYYNNKQKEYYHNNLEKKRELNKNTAKKDVINLTDRYVKSRLYSDFGIDYNIINDNPQLIELKRNQILLNRKIKEYEK